MPDSHGSFMWYELMTTDADAASRFYADLLGWSVADFQGDGPAYRIFSMGDAAVAGVMTLPARAGEAGLRAGWLGYIAVDDVDAAIASITAAGGTVRMPASDLPGVGRIALVADPQGVAFYIMRGVAEQPSLAFEQTTPGHCAWNELATTDADAAMAFYTSQFGWTPGGVMPMGDLGDYRFINQHGGMIGAIMPRQQPGPPPMWVFYMRVADIDSAPARVVRGGGTVVHGPVDVPGGDRIIHAADPQGLMFALVGRHAI